MIGSAPTGGLARHDALAAYRDLADIRRQEHDLLYRDGGVLFPPDHDYLDHRLNDLSVKIGWQSHGG